MGSGSSDMIEAATAADRLTRRYLVLMITRALGVLGATLLVYVLTPVNGEGGAHAVGLLAAVGIAVVLAVFFWQMARVRRSRTPVMTAVEALVLVFGMFLILFSLLYVSMSASDPASFSEPVGKVAGIYFTTTVLSTVGFGDITAASDNARILVTVQMVLGALLIGSAVKLLGFSARSAVKDLAHSPSGVGAAVTAAEGDVPGGGEVGSRGQEPGSRGREPGSPGR